MDELAAAWLTLVRAPGLHAGNLRPLLQNHGDVAAIARASPASLRAAGANAGVADSLAGRRDANLAQDLAWFDKGERHFISCMDPLYPRLLAELPDAPLGLFVHGDPALLSLPQLAVVGSRNPTPGGRDNARSFASHLVRCGLAITSGLAVGIDTAAHEGALDGEGITIAVCGTGLDIAYPKSNEALAARISARGALVSEFPLGTPAIKGNFPRRNRIISGLTLGTLVVEAAVQSGSLITARLAAEQGREVFAIPGSIHNPLARGCHQLIRHGAKLVETADDIFAELRALTDALKDAPQVPLASEAAGGSAVALDKDYEILLDALGFEPAGVDLLVERTGFRADEVASMLLILELDGHIESYPGGLYVRKAAK